MPKIILPTASGYINNNNNLSNIQNQSQHVANDKCPKAIELIQIDCIEDNVPDHNDVLNIEDEVNQPLTSVALTQITAVSATARNQRNTPPAGIAPISKIFIDDLTERRKQWRIPWFLLIISFVQISVYLIADECMQQRLMFIPELHKQYWRFVTYMLLHSDLLHLMLNMCLQCLIGFCLESEQGHWRIVCIYFVGGICGSMIPALLEPDLSLLGSSAGVYALLASHVPHMFKNFVHLSQRYLRLLAIGILVLSDIGFTTFHFVVNHNANPRICLEAHIAGGLSGLLVASLIYTSTVTNAFNCCNCYGCSSTTHTQRYF